HPATEGIDTATADRAVIERLENGAIARRVTVDLADLLPLHRKAVALDMGVTDDAVFVVAVIEQADQHNVTQQRRELARRHLLARGIAPLALEPAPADDALLQDRTLDRVQRNDSGRAFRHARRERYEVGSLGHDDAS